MKFLRVLTNCLVNGLYFSLLLTLLVADLNVNLVFNLGILGKLTIFLLVSYGLMASFVSTLAALFYRFFSGKKGKPGFISASFLTLSSSLWTLLFLVIFRENYTHFLPFFVPGLRFFLRAQMVGLFVLAIAGLVVHYRYHHRKPLRMYFPVYFALLGLVLISVFWLRLNYPHAQKPIRLADLDTKKITRRVTLLNLEGMSLDFILPLTNERKLPNFAWLIEKGCWGRLEGFTPSDPFVLHHSVNTGKLPGKHRQISEVRYRVPGVRARLEVVPRFILFRQLTRTGLLKILPNESAPAVKDMWRIFEDYQAAVVRKDRSASPTPPGKPSPRAEKLLGTFYKDLQYETSWIFAQVKQAFSRDAESEENAFQKKAEVQPQLFSLYLDGLNTAEMYFYKYSFPEFFGDIRQEEIQKYGAVIEKYYQFYDQIISKYLASLKEDELFIVYSPYGAEPLPFWKRVVEWVLGNSYVSSYHEQAPAGAVFFYGKGIVRGKNMDTVRLIDLAPTILYFLGLPVGKDMDGIVCGSLFEREFTEENPVFTISSYEDVRIKKSSGNIP